MRRASATLPAAASRCARPNDGPAMPRQAAGLLSRMPRAPRRSGQALRAHAQSRYARWRNGGRARSPCDTTAPPSRIGARSSTSARMVCSMTASGSRRTDACAAASASSCRSNEESTRASMLCAMASAGFSSMAWRNERMASCRSPVCIWTTPMDTWASASEGSSSRARRAAVASVPPRPEAPSLASRESCGNRRVPTTPRRTPDRCRAPAARPRPSSTPSNRSTPRGMPSLEIFEMRVRVHDVTAREPCASVGVSCTAIAWATSGELTLQCEYVFELPVVTIGPERFVGACAMSWTFSRTRPPTRCAEPSRIASTFSSRAISGSDNAVLL